MSLTRFFLTHDTQNSFYKSSCNKLLRRVPSNIVFVCLESQKSALKEDPLYQLFSLASIFCFSLELDIDTLDSDMTKIRCQQNLQQNKKAKIKEVDTNFEKKRNVFQFCCKVEALKTGSVIHIWKNLCSRQVWLITTFTLW